MERTIERVKFSVPVQPKATRVAAYARVSSGKDAMKHSLSAQVSYYSDLIQRRSGWLYCGVYADDATTGTKDDRTNFQKLLYECRAGNIDLIITKSISRFARNTVTLLETVRKLKGLGIGVYFEEQRIYTLSSDGELMMTILASYAQAESLSASENQKWRIRKGFENGELVNLRFLFGYRIDHGKIRIEPSEAGIVREIFERAVAGDSLSAIARDLNARGVDRAFGGEWKAARVRELLSNEKYAGNALLQKTYVKDHLEKRKVSNRGELPMFYAENTHEAIVDEDLFAKAQEVLARISERTKNVAKPTRSPFSGVVVCERCGAKFKHRLNHGRPCWSCTTFVDKGRQYCNARQIPEFALYALTTEVLGCEDYDRELLVSTFSRISAEGNRITYRFADGRSVVKEWKHKSRADSWTPEMREQARAKTRKRLEEQR